MEREEKARLRREYIEKRKAILPVMQREKSEKICERIAATSAYKEAKTVLFYAATGGEPDLTALWEQALRDGKRTAFPKCDTETHTMCAVLVKSDADFKTGAYGISEPQGGEVLSGEAIDLILVPAVAFDKKGMRLGRGAGYYDRYLEDYGGRTIGVCFSECRAERLPAEVHDKPVDAVVCE